MPISPLLVTLLHICGVLPTLNCRHRRKLCADIAKNSARAPISLRRAPMSLRRAPMFAHRTPISSHRMASVWVFRDVSQSFKSVSQCFKSVSWCFTSGSQCFMTFHDASQCFTSVSWCFSMFNNVLQRLVSCATIGIATSATAYHPKVRDNAEGIGNNSTEICDDAAGESDPMLNCLLNGDWSNNVPGR